MRLTGCFVLALDGAEATGKSGHARDLAAALSALGIPAEAYHHPAPPPMLEDPIGRAVWYVRERTALERRAKGLDAPRVFVADRWWLSTQAYAEVAPPAVGTAMRQLVGAESLAWGHGLHVPVDVAILDAPDAELERRTLARGADASANDLHPRRAEIRAWYRARAEARSLPLVDTSAPREEVAAGLVALAHTFLSQACLLAPSRPPKLDVEVLRGAFRAAMAGMPGFDANGSPTP